jgi:DNA-binding response OmpR family regulator
MSVYDGHQESPITDLIRDLRAVCAPGLERSFARLEAEADRLTTEIAVLKMADNTDPLKCQWDEYGLTNCQKAIMGVLKRRGAAGASKDALVSSVFAHRNVDDWPEAKVMDVQICKIRTKLESYGAPYWIETVWGVGHILHEGCPPTSLAKASNGFRLNRPLAMTRDAIRLRNKNQSAA